MAPRRKRQEAGRTAKKGDKPSAAGQKRKQEQTKQVRVGVSCYHLIFVSQKQKHENQKWCRRKPKEKRTSPQKNKTWH